MPYKNRQTQKEAQHRSYLRNKAKLLKRNSDRIKETRRKVREYKEERGCSECGYNKYGGAIDAHHPNGKDSQEDCIARLCKRNFAWETILAELEKCILLCSNCHREHHRGE